MRSREPSAQGQSSSVGAPGPLVGRPLAPSKIPRLAGSSPSKGTSRTWKVPLLDVGDTSVACTPASDAAFVDSASFPAVAGLAGGYAQQTYQLPDPRSYLP